MLINRYIPTTAGRSPSSVPLFWWQGWSGSWYVTSVFEIERLACDEPGTFLLVRREADGRATPLLVGAGRNVSEELFSTHGDALLRAIKAGAREVHVHLSAECDEERRFAMEDIAKGWHMPALMETPQHRVGEATHSSEPQPLGSCNF